MQKENTGQALFINEGTVNVQSLIVESFCIVVMPGSWRKHLHFRALQKIRSVQCQVRCNSDEPFKKRNIRKCHDCNTNSSIQGVMARCQRRVANN